MYILHPKRGEDVFLQVGAEGLAGNNLQHGGQHIVGQAVNPMFGRVAHQRGGGNGPHHLPGGGFAAGVFLHGKDGGGLDIIGQAGGHGQQIHNADLPGGAAGWRLGRQVHDGGGGHLLQHLHLFKFRQVPGQIVLQVYQALFHQLHEGCAGDDLGGGKEIVQVRIAHGPGVGGVRPACHTAVHLPVMVKDHAVAAGNVVVGLQRIEKGGQLRKIHTFIILFPGVFPIFLFL